MGEVYRAHDTRLQRDVALKVVPESALRDPEARKRLLQEARTASSLRHPNICTIYDVGDQEGQAFIAMELVDGRSMRDLLPREAFPVASVLRHGCELADAVAHAHVRGVVHRDIKAANVMVEANGQVKLLDFGLALRAREAIDEATRSRGSLDPACTLAGTLPYLSPEVLEGHPADTRSDL